MWKFNSADLILMCCFLYVSAVPFKLPFKEKENQKPNSNGEELVFANVIFRHGERNIARSYPNDPHKDESLWPGGFGALTKKGKKQSFKMGQHLRKRYNKILGDKYSPNVVFVRSTDVDRSLMTAQAVLAGLYPPTKEEIWNEDILWQPIPVHTIPVIEDHMFLRLAPCPRFNEISEQFLKQSELARDTYAKVTEFYPILSERSGLNITTILETFNLFNTLYVEHLHNKTLPDWANEIIEPNGVIDKIMKFFLIKDSETPELARITSGFLLKEMLQRFDQKINSTLQPNRSLWLYSVQDYTMVNLLNSLGLFKPHAPAFASSLHFELYKTDEIEHYVQFSYKQSESEDLLPMNIPRCGEKCPLHRFNELYSEIIPDDYDIECKKSSILL